MLKKTPLYSIHETCQAKFTEFHGWLLPLHYGSPIQEHMYVREDAGIFDVSHMTIIDIIGTGSRQFLRHIMTRDIDEIKYLGGACYSCMCNEHGGIIDDVLIYYRQPDNYRLVFNAATKERVLNWLDLQAQNFNIGIQIRHELCMLAIQGPNAISKTLPLLSPYQMDKLSTLRRFESFEEQAIFFSRTGYTGEDGLECIMPKDSALVFFKKLIQAGIKPCGLAARDSLRLEAGYLLNGQDMDERTNPLTAGLNWTISTKDTTRIFIGKNTIHTNNHKLVGLILSEPAIMRHGQKVFHDDQLIGTITSGAYSPCLKKSIALARVIDSPFIDNLAVEIRGKKYLAALSTTRFYSKK